MFSIVYLFVRIYKTSIQILLRAISTQSMSLRDMSPGKFEVNIFLIYMIHFFFFLDSSVFLENIQSGHE